MYVEEALDPDPNISQIGSNPLPGLAHQRVYTRVPFTVGIYTCT